MKTINKVILSLLVVGSVLIVIGFGMNGYKQMQTVYEKDGNYWGWRIGSSKSVSEEFSDITSLNLNIDASSLRIEEYSGKTVLVEGKNINKNVKIKNDSGTLVIEDRGFSFNFGIGIGWNDGGTITIYIPEDTKFDKATLDVDAGSIYVDRLEAKTVDISVDAGQFEADTIICKSGTFNVNAGSIEIDTLDAQDSDFDCDVGSINATLVGAFEDYRYSANCDIGSIRIGNYRAGGLSSDNHGGSGERKITADCNVGDITIEMEG